jgi:hypothetical protein
VTVDDETGGLGLDDLVRQGDLDRLMIEVDRLCSAADWDRLVSLRDRCDAAIQLGRQLWGVARFAEYRLALEAPGPYAASVCQAEASRFTLGPLTEVSASTHSWDDLADHLPSPWAAAAVAQERVLRGEDLRGDPRAYPDELELPLVLSAWEPDYPLPRYRSHDVVEGGPTPADEAILEEVPASAGPGEPLVLGALERALRDIVATWVDRSEGTSSIAIVEGDGPSAATAAAPGAEVLGRISTDVAFEHLAWAAASSGVHGRRRGMAAGRSAAFWLARVALGLTGPEAPAVLDDEVQRVRWYAVGGGEPRGWQLRLAFEVEGEGWGAAVIARDVEDDATTVRLGRDDDALSLPSLDASDREGRWNDSSS